jgi:hypothetical protein
MSNLPPVEKNASRDDRLQLRRNNEEVLRKTLANQAREKCSALTTAFGNCAKANGMGVVLFCREENMLMQRCLDKYYNEEEFDKFLVAHNYPPHQGDKGRIGIVESIRKRFF